MQRSWNPPVNYCAQCGEMIIAPVWAENRGERCIRNVWSCEACGYQFETEVYLGPKAGRPYDETVPFH
jgi:hypothetical protein